MLKNLWPLLNVLVLAIGALGNFLSLALKKKRKS